MSETTEAGTKALLLTRPAGQSRAFLAAVAEALGRPPRAVISPLAEIRPTGAAVPAEGALILTSGRAVEAAGPALAGRRAFCVGDRTAALARSAGAEALSASGDAGALYALVLAHRPARATHLRGAEATGDLAARLTAAGIPTAEAILYETVPLPLSAEAATLMDSAPVLAPVFSPASARRLAEAAGPALGRLTIAAISPAAAAPVAAARRVETAAAPDAEAMLRLVLRLWADLP